MKRCVLCLTRTHAGYLGNCLVRATQHKECATFSNMKHLEGGSRSVGRNFKEVKLRVKFTTMPNSIKLPSDWKIVTNLAAVPLKPQFFLLILFPLSDFSGYFFLNHFFLPDTIPFFYKYD